jgi:hypothetical protein
MYAWDAVWSNVTDERYCSTSLFYYAYDHTSAGSALRNLAVDQSEYYVDTYDMEPCRQEFPHEMLFDLMLVYKKAVLPILPGDKTNQESRRGILQATADGFREIPLYHNL